MGFLDLPRELRDAIYELALVADGPIDVLRLQNASSSSGPANLAPVLLRLSRQILHEALPVLYGLNTFRASIPIHSFRTYDFSNRYLLSHSSRSLLPSSFHHPSLQLVQRVAIYLNLTETPIHRCYDPCFADNVLRALILDASPATVLLEPVDLQAYWDKAEKLGTQWANIQTSLVLAECQEVTHQMLAYAQMGPPNTVVIPPIMSIIWTPRDQCGEGFISVTVHLSASAP